MPAAGDVGRGDVVHDLFIPAQFIDAETFPHIAVDVDSVGHRFLLFFTAEYAEKFRFPKKYPPDAAMGNYEEITILFFISI
jgi:hypothetical protein